MSYRYAVTGATGQLGRLVLKILKDKGLSEKVVALVRSTAKGADLGIALREADYDQPAKLVEALAKVETLLLISSNEIGKRAAQHANVIDAAKTAGVKRIIYTSLLHADRSSLSLAGEHLATETHLKKSGIPFVILRNGWYTENHTSSIGAALAGGAFIGSAGNGRFSSATRLDFAEAAFAVLTGSGNDGKIYELAGDVAYTLSDLATEISKQTSKDIPFKNLPEAEYASILAGFGLPAHFAQAIAGWDIGALKGDLFDDGRQLSKLIGRPTTSLPTAVAEALKAL